MRSKCDYNKIKGHSWQNVGNFDIMHVSVRTSQNEVHLPKDKKRFWFQGPRFKAETLCIWKWSISFSIPMELYSLFWRLLKKIQVYDENWAARLANSRKEPTISTGTWCWGYYTREGWLCVPMAVNCHGCFLYSSNGLFSFFSVGHKGRVFGVLCLPWSKHWQWCLLWPDGQKCMEIIVNVILVYCFLLIVSFMQIVVDLEPVSLKNDLKSK